MGSIYKRGDRYYIRFKDPDGNWVARAASETAAEAKKVLREVERAIATGNLPKPNPTPDVPPPAPKVLTDFVPPWIDRRRQRGLRNWRNERAHLDMHILPHLGKLEPTEIRVRHIIGLMDHLRSNAELAPRTVLKIYGTLHCFFKDLVVNEVIASSPCVLTKEHLPKNRDKDREWRANAVFSREEAQVLISSASVPDDRQMLYALLLLTGARFGEAVGLRWRDLDPRAKPLMRLSIARSYDEGTKTESPRLVPVHPVLAEMLLEWRRTGFPALMGRAPGPDDLIIASREKVMRTKNQGRNKFLDDLARLGLRHRRIHDTRRTFITLARVDGARKDVLEQVTHATRGNIMDLYTSLPWPTLCEAVSCLKLSRIQGEELEALELTLAVEQRAIAGVHLEAPAPAKATAPIEVEDEWSFLASDPSEITSDISGKDSSLPEGNSSGGLGGKSLDNDSILINQESGIPSATGLVTSLVTEKKNRVAHVQKSWKNHAIQLVEAPGVEPGSEVTRRRCLRA